MLGPTQEEVVTPLVAGEFSCYRDLPVNLYQIDWKYRDELRPRFGLLRGREFLMKDAYSFDRDEDGMRRVYEVMYEAYRRVFDRCGLDVRVVEADPGEIGGGRQPRVHGRRRGGRGPVRPVRALRLPRRHGGRHSRARPSRRLADGLEPLTEVDTPGRGDDRG